MKRIRVLVNYGGFNTQERRILPGEYEVNDPALFGAADYLIQNGQAVVLDDAPDVNLSEFKADGSIFVSSEINEIETGDTSVQASKPKRKR